MANTTRQRELFAGEAWQVLYRSFSQVNFNASDPVSINAALRNYIQVNFPEDFNDWIESSEFVAIIDLLSWLAGTLAFRTDVAVRENFLETAEARESVLRLARFLSYNAHRCRPATGVLKVVSVSTDDDVTDSFGLSLTNQQVLWDNPDDANWQERFTAVLNAAFIGTNPYGVPLKQGTVQDVTAQLYRINGLVSRSQLSFDAPVNGEQYPFEACNGDFDDGGVLRERAPDPAAGLHIFALNDGNGNGSRRTGFFVLFKQGTTGTQTFTIGQPRANQLLDLGDTGINQDDVWVQSVADNGAVLADWTPVPVLLDSNITYNALPADQRNIFSVVTRDNDAISVRFADGLYGNAPSGNIRVTYRRSNGLAYVMKPLDVDEVRIPFAFTNALGQPRTLFLTLSLQESVNNAATAESIADIRARAPQVYATQNRMVSGEDYNVFPLQTNLARRIKAVNRTYSGHSRYVDLHDPTGTYQDLSIFAEDGILFRETADGYAEAPTALNLSPDDLCGLYIDPLIASDAMAQAVRDLYVSVVRSGGIPAPEGLAWHAPEKPVLNTTGWFSGLSDAARTLLWPGAQMQFRAKDGAPLRWTAVAAVSGDPDQAPRGSAHGPVTLTDAVPNNASVTAILPRFVSALSVEARAAVADKLAKRLSFTLAYDFADGGAWSVEPPVPRLGERVLSGSRTLLLSADYLSGGGAATGLWRFVGRGLDYVFESLNDVEWYDDGSRAIDQSTGAAKADGISVLRINQDRNDPSGRALGRAFELAIGKIWCYPNGLTEPRRIRVAFAGNGFGQPRDPDTFFRLVDNTGAANQTLFWHHPASDASSDDGVSAQPYDASDTRASGLLVGYDTVELMQADGSQGVGTTGYVARGAFALQNGSFWTVAEQAQDDGSTQTAWVQDFSGRWRAAQGRGPNTASLWVSAGQEPAATTGDQLAFHWRHYARTDHRIDPSITNLHDIFVLTSSYDAAVRAWIKKGAAPNDLPAPPSELDLRLAFADQEQFAMFSDGIVWRPVRYKLLFGPSAIPQCRANFKIVRLPDATLSDGEIKSRVVAALNRYFDVGLWDFGETFFFTEAAAYVHLQLAGIIASIVIVPLNAESTFGNEFEISCAPDEIFVSTATVANIQIIGSNTPANLRIR